MNKNKLLVITGPTATGKTRLAALLANQLDGEIISADSRQVYRGMDIGSGKDIADYNVDNKLIPYHLIDILDAGEEYNVFQFQKDFYQKFNEIKSKDKLPILCGGTGMYIESVLADYNFAEVAVDPDFRKSLDNMRLRELQMLLIERKSLHNTTDLSDRERCIRALEIAEYEKNYPYKANKPQFDYKIFAINFDREIIRNRITERLRFRLDYGMITEIENLLNLGLSIEQLKFYGLEYRYIAMFINKEITYFEMFRLLNIAIHQFAKRQMTWFRRMEKKGFKINWINGKLSEDEKLEQIIDEFKKNVR